MKLYFKYFSIHLKSRMQYKISFFLSASGQFLVSFSTLLGVYFMFRRFHTVADFSFQEVLLCFATMLMSFSLAECFGRGFDAFPRIIGNGEFDRILVRPRNTIFQVFAAQLDFTRAGRLLQAVIVFAYAIPASKVRWTPDRLLTLLLMIVCGSIVFFCLFVISAALSFFTIEGLEFMNILTYGGMEFGRYPFSIYGAQVLRFLTFVVPLALFQYYPLLYLLGRKQSPLYMIAPVPGLLFIIPTYGCWRFGLKHYVSTGS